MLEKLGCTLPAFLAASRKLARDRPCRVIGRGHHLRHHHAGAVLAQFVGQRLRADERHVVEGAAIARLARFADEGGAGLVGADLHHGVRRGSGHAVATASATSDRVALHRGLRQRLEVRAASASVTPSTGRPCRRRRSGRTRRSSSAQVGELPHDQRGFVVVGGAQVKRHRGGRARAGPWRR
jgi:hypothetical protein